MSLVSLPSTSQLPSLWPPLQSCAPDTLARLVAASAPAQFDANDMVLSKGDPADRVVVVSAGVVRVFHVKEPGVEFTVKLLRGPAPIGIVETVTRHPWEASVQCLVPAAAVIIPAAAILEELDRDPTLARAILSEMAEQFESSIRAVQHLGFDDCETRLLRLLLEYGEHFGRPVPEGVLIRCPLALERLAREVGVNRRSIDRALSALGRARLVERNAKGWLVLTDRDAARARLDARS